MQLIDGDGVGSFINSTWHTKFDENCDIVDIKDGSGRYCIKAARDIRTGEELYLTYGRTYKYEQLKKFSHVGAEDGDFEDDNGEEYGGIIEAYRNQI
jgi:hypothetical protein